MIVSYIGVDFNRKPSWARRRLLPPMTLPRLQPATLRRVTRAAVVALAAIVLTGGAVRLTGSGLGCPTWPRCTAQSYTAELAFHPLVEFVNRLITIGVGVVVVAAVAGSLLRLPRRPDLVWLSLGLAAGYLGQAVLGGLTVLFDLRPELVMAHFLLSMLLLWDAFVLHQRAGATDSSRRPLVRGEVVLLSRVVTGAAAVVLFLGTVVTGTGPNSGAEAVHRLPFELRAVTALHSDLVLVLLGVTAALLVLLRVVNAPTAARRRGIVLVAVMAAQTTLGFTQYALGLPRLLVGLHIAGATAFWLASLWLAEGLYERPHAATPAVVLPAEPLAVGGAAPGRAQRSRESTPTARKSSVR